MKMAIITGVTGQVGSYMVDFLLANSFKVVGFMRRSSTNTLERVEQHLNNDDFTIEVGDITDSGSVYNLVNKYQLDYFFNMCAQSHVAESFLQPELTLQVNTMGVLNCLEAVRKFSPPTRFLQMSTSEMFGSNVNDDGYQDEGTPFSCNSPYAVSKLAAHHLVKNYRDAYGLAASCAIMFNAESPRRGEQFVTRKITLWVARFYHLYADLGYPKQISDDEKLALGNLDSQRDWGAVQDYVRAIYSIADAVRPMDYVISTGETHSIKDFLSVAFETIGVQDWTPYVRRDERFYRPVEVKYLKGDSSKLRGDLNWQPEISFKKLVRNMVYADIDKYDE